MLGTGPDQLRVREKGECHDKGLAARKAPSVSRSYKQEMLKPSLLRGSGKGGGFRLESFVPSHIT